MVYLIRVSYNILPRICSLCTSVNGGVGVECGKPLTQLWQSARGSIPLTISESAIGS